MFISFGQATVAAGDRFIITVIVRGEKKGE
jgi:hypothetical protein